MRLTRAISGLAIYDSIHARYFDLSAPGMDMLPADARPKFEEDEDPLSRTECWLLCRSLTLLVASIWLVLVISV